MMKKHIINFMMIITVMISVLFIRPAVVHAAEKEYRVDAADFTVAFSETGEAEIKEHWIVTYENGDFTRFYKDIFNASNQLEYISDVKIAEVSINGVKCEQSQSLDRVNNHFFFEALDDRFTVHWFKAAHNETVEYDILYSIPNAVKLDENNRAEFCYRLIGENFPKTVGNVSAVVYFPKKDDTVTCSISQGEYDINSDAVYLNAGNVSGMYKLRLNMSPEGFVDLTKIIDVSVPENVQRAVDDSDSDVWFIIIVVIVILVVIVKCGFYVIIIVDELKSGKAKKYAKNNSKCFKKAADDIEASGIPLVWYLFSPFKRGLSSSNYDLLLYAGIFDLCGKGYMEVSPKGLILKEGSGMVCTDEVQNKMNDEFINLLSRLFTISRTEDGSVFLYETLKNEIKKKHSDIGNAMNEWEKAYRSEIKGSQLYKEIGRASCRERVYSGV